MALEYSEILEGAFERIGQVGLKAFLNQLQRDVLVRVLHNTYQNSTKAAEWLRINRTTVVEMRRRYGLRIRGRDETFDA